MMEQRLMTGQGGDGRTKRDDGARIDDRTGERWQTMLLMWRQNGAGGAGGQ